MDSCFGKGGTSRKDGSLLGIRGAIPLSVQRCTEEYLYTWYLQGGSSDVVQGVSSTQHGVCSGDVNKGEQEHTCSSRRNIACAFLIKDSLPVVEDSLSVCNK